jgi:DnaJ-class molecular chaperone
MTAKTFFEICRRCGGSGSWKERTCTECFGRGMVDYKAVEKGCNNQIKRLKEQIAELQDILAKVKRRDKPQDAIQNKGESDA